MLEPNDTMRYIVRTILMKVLFYEECLFAVLEGIKYTTKTVFYPKATWLFCFLYLVLTPIVLCMRAVYRVPVVPASAKCCPGSPCGDADS